jgi:hypothetical protein
MQHKNFANIRNREGILQQINFEKVNSIVRYSEADNVDVLEINFQQSKHWLTLPHKEPQIIVSKFTFWSESSGLSPVSQEIRPFKLYINLKNTDLLRYEKDTKRVIASLNGENYVHSREGDIQDILDGNISDPLPDPIVYECPPLKKQS